MNRLDAYTHAYTDVAHVPETEESSKRDTSRGPDQIHLLIRNPALYDPLRKPRYPIVLCHGEWSNA